MEESDWWWIDYLEDELDANLEKDLALLLDHSQEDRDSFESFRLLRQWVRESDPLAAKAEAENLARSTVKIRQNVMAAIERMEIEKAPLTQPRINISDWSDGLTSEL